MAFSVAALMIVALLFGLALAIGTAHEHLVLTLQTKAAQVKHWGGAILVLVGLWLITLAIWADMFAQAFPV